MIERIDMDMLGHPVPPTRELMERYAERQNLLMPSDQLEEEVAHVRSLLRVFDRLDSLGEPDLPLRHSSRDPGRAPGETEDPHNAIIRFCRVSGANRGPLSGMRVAVKDNIAVAGIPMTNGERAHEPVTPTEDAVVVERILDAGAVIVAKTNISESDFGRTRNPLNPRYSAGGSSSGSAAAVTSGLSDAALETDQGGSIRIPAAWCGIVGMKPTHGLVPTHGLTHWDHSLDHVGPMTANVHDNATMLEVIAGADWRDGQARGASPSPGDYTGAAQLGIKGIRIGVIAESLEPSGCTSGILAAFEHTQKKLSDLGAELVPVSVPLWAHAPTIWLATVTFGLTATAASYGQRYGLLGRVDLTVLSAAAARYHLGREAPRFGGKTLPLVFEHLREAYLGVHFGRAQNLRLELQRQVDARLEDVDLLITPTTPTAAARLGKERPTVRGSAPTQIDGEGPSRVPLPEAWSEPGTGLSNCCGMNLTGHPALTVPSGRGEADLPAGLQIIGRRFEENTIYRAGFAVESVFTGAN